MDFDEFSKQELPRMVKERLEDFIEERLKTVPVVDIVRDCQALISQIWQQKRQSTTFGSSPDILGSDMASAPGTLARTELPRSRIAQYYQEPPHLTEAGGPALLHCQNHDQGREQSTVDSGYGSQPREDTIYRPISFEGACTSSTGYDSFLSSIPTLPPFEDATEFDSLEFP